MVFALIGNQNCGKTTLFNQFTGSNQHTGNFPGVTVEKKEGLFKKNKKMSVVDLPGIYSLSPYTQEEIVTRDFLIKEKPDAIINILDATNIERNLYLTLQLMELNTPMVLALNFMDELTASGNHIKITKLEELLGIHVVPISASKNEGIDELIEIAIETAKNKTVPKRLDFCSGPIHKAIHSIAHIIDDKAIKKGYPTRFCATKLVENDEIIKNELELTEAEIDIISHIVEDMEKTLNNDKDAILADMRYDYIEKICNVCVFKRGETKEYIRSVKIDNFLTHKYLSIPIFLAIMLFVFWLTFGVIGGTISDLFASGIDAFIEAVGSFLVLIKISPTINAFIVNGVLAGVGSVLSFMPTILILFFFLSMLEDSGYMARVAFVMDKLLRKIGLSGRSFVPMLIGFGCSVPAIMATRTLPSHRDRKMTIMLVPFMSCSAKLPIYALFTSVFFKENQALVMTGLYLLGIVVGVLVGLLLKGTIFKGEPVPFVMELPAYRLPSLKTVFLNMWDKAKDFIIKAFTIIFFASIIIWVLQSFDFSFNLVEDSSNSVLAYLGKFIAPIFIPLGFSDWRVATALVTGLTAKEAVVSTMTVLMKIGGSEELLNNYFTTAQAFSFLVFTLLYMPCVATLAAIKREMGGIYNAVLVMAFQTVIAWIVAFIIYNIILIF
jgi:ferrous iron transport protein B